MNQSMNTQDAVSANYAECFVTIDGTRYSMLMAKEFEGKATINTKEVYKLGNPVVGHKAQTMALAFSMTIYKWHRDLRHCGGAVPQNRRNADLHCPNLQR